MKRRPTFRIVRNGRVYQVLSDSPAAAVTGGVIVTGLNRSDAERMAERLGCEVKE